MPTNKAVKNAVASDNKNKHQQLCIIDLFAGQGGFITGFNKVDGWKHILAVELAEKHCAVLRIVHPDVPVLQQDVSLMDWTKLLNGTEIDCIIGGPPCQPFSQGNNRRNGWDDSRNGIPFFVKAVTSINPKAFLLENVPRLWGGDQKHHIQELIEELIEFGYIYTDAAILDAADFGAPCHRRRLFVYGTKQPHIWPVKTHKGNPVAAREFLVPLLDQREPDGAPLPEWVKPKIQGARGDIIIDCKQGNKVGRQYVSLDEPCFTLVATQGIRHRIRYKGKYYRMKAPEAAALQGMDFSLYHRRYWKRSECLASRSMGKDYKEILIKLADRSKVVEMGKKEIFAQRIIEWYRKEGRSFPWRKTKNAFHILISEIMLQKTDSKKVLSVYPLFIKKYRTVRQLAHANISTLKKEIRILGISDRARRLKIAAKTILLSYGGKVPSNRTQLLSLLGVGDYIANAVLCFAFNQDVPILDTNVIRVINRVFSVESNKTRARTDKEFWQFAGSLIPTGQAVDYNRGVLDFAATICTARSSSCPTCPVSDICDYCSELISSATSEAKIAGF